MPSQSNRRVALLRAVNVSGNSLPMAELRAFAEALGLAEAKTLLQSGNLVFADPEGRPPEALSALLEEEARARLSLDTDFILRRPEEWRALVSGNPFTAEAEDDPAHLLVMPLKGEAPGKDALAALRAAIVGPERVELKGRDLFVVYPDGVGRSKLTTALIERKLGGVRGTGRNWNTVRKIAAALGA